MGKIRLIIWREYITRVRKKSFLIMTFLGPLLIAGGVSGAIYLGLQEDGPQTVMVVDKAQIFLNKLKETEGIKFYYDDALIDEPVDSVIIRKFKAMGPYTTLVIINDQVLKNNTVQVYYRKVPSQTVQNYLSAEIEQVMEREKLRLKNIDPEDYRGVKTHLVMQLRDVDRADEESHDQAKALIGFVFGYLIFIFIFLYGIQVMRGVMEEKQSRVVEVLISSVRPFQLMMGKIVGIALVGLTQFLLWVVASSILFSIGLGSARGSILKHAQQEQQMKITALQAEEDGTTPAAGEGEAASFANALIDIWDQTPVVAVLLLFVFYFLGGYLLYSALYAAIGSAIDSEAETQQFMFPITIPMVIGIYVAQTAVYNPDGPAVFWCSIIPFTSPVVMMIRVAMGNAFEHPAHLALSMALLVGTFIFTTWLAGRIYRTGILMYGKKVTWKELGKWLFYRG